MITLSNFHDYYDTYVAIYDRDEKFIYHRKNPAFRQQKHYLIQNIYLKTIHAKIADSPNSSTAVRSILDIMADKSTLIPTTAYLPKTIL